MAKPKKESGNDEVVQKNANTVFGLGERVMFIRFDSTAIVAAAYSLMDDCLYVQFKTNQHLMYCYEGVPFKLFKQMCKSASVGNFFVRNIKSTYPYTSVVHISTAVRSSTTASTKYVDAIANVLEVAAANSVNMANLIMNWVDKFAINSSDIGVSKARAYANGASVDAPKTIGLLAQQIAETSQKYNAGLDMVSKYLLSRAYQ